MNDHLKEDSRMRRYYLSKVIGDGSSPEDAIRAELADKGVPHVAVMKDGAKAGDWCLCLVNTEDHTVLRDLKDTEEWPDFPLDGKINAINQVARARINNALTKRKINLNAVSLADGYRDALNNVGRLLRPEFDVDKFDV